MVAEIMKLVECIDNVRRFQSRGDVATYYLTLENANLKSIKYNADCVKEKLGIEHRIGDSFFHVWKGGKSQKEEMWILVETKGKGDDYFEQLDRSLNLFADAECSVHGRYIGTNVPAIIPSKDRKEFDKLQRKFVLKNGTFYLENKKMVENFFSIKQSSHFGVGA